MNSKLITIVAFLGLVAAFTTLATSQSTGPKSQSSKRATKRVQQPDWTDAEKKKQAAKVFFADAFRDALKGERPTNWAEGAAASSGEAAEGDAVVWSKIISSESLEDGVKSLKNELTKSVVQPAQFASGGHRVAREQFTVLALLFAVIGEYDGEVRWKQDAAAIQDRFQNLAKAATGDAAAFTAARNSKQDLEDLIRGNRWPQQLKRKPIDDWTTVANRRVLMRVLESSLDDLIKPATSSESSFRDATDRLKREAEVSSAITQVLMHESMEDALDDDYKAYCKELQDAAEKIGRAVEQEDLGRAAKAAGAMHKACSDCHEMYRG